MSKTPFKEGFDAGIRWQREYILDFIEVHKEKNIAISVEDIVEEVNAQYKSEMLAKLKEMGL